MKISPNCQQSTKYPFSNRVAESKGGCGSGEFVDGCVVGLLVEADNDLCDVGLPSSCDAAQLSHFLLCFCCNGRASIRVTECVVRLGRSVSVHATQRPTTATARDISLSSMCQSSCQPITSIMDVNTRCSAIAERPRCRVRYSFGQKWKTGTSRQYFTDIIGLASTNVI